jgi:hypothetical protein
VLQAAELDLRQAVFLKSIEFVSFMDETPMLAVSVTSAASMGDTPCLSS